MSNSSVVVSHEILVYQYHEKWHRAYICGCEMGFGEPRVLYRFALGVVVVLSAKLAVQRNAPSCVR